MRGIVLAGGTGSRLSPLTTAVSKQLLPVYDVPLVYHPLSTLMVAGLREVCVVTTARDRGRFEELLGDGGDLGMGLTYAVQDEPRGIAEVFLLVAHYLEGRASCLVLGDNVFHGDALPSLLTRAARHDRGARIFGTRVTCPERYGNAVLDGQGRLVAVEEKPARPRSPYAIPGLYFYDGRAPELAARLAPSARGELEITDLHRAYLERGELELEVLGPGIAWFDAGTPESLLEVSNFMHTLEKRQGRKVACLEEVAFRAGFIGRDALRRLATTRRGGEYGDYLRRVADEAGEPG